MEVNRTAFAAALGRLAVASSLLRHAVAGSLHWNAAADGVHRNATAGGLDGSASAGRFDRDPAAGRFDWNDAAARSLVRCAPIALERNAMLTLAPAIGTEIRCEQGAVWITQDHDPRDIVLERGERFTLDVDAPALVQAIEAATIRIGRPTATTQGRSETAPRPVANVQDGCAREM